MSTWAEMSTWERDALVATEVMGWGEMIGDEENSVPWCWLGDDGYTTGWGVIPTPKCLPNCSYAPQNEDYEHSEDCPQKHFYPHGLDYKGIWSPSTDIAAAWEVVEKMREGEYFVTVEMVGDIADSKWECTAWDGMSTKDSGWVDTAPEAICLAALRAVGVEV